MPTVVVPFRGTEGKSRLAGLPLDARAALREAMLADVLAACEAVGATYLVTSAHRLGTTVTLVVDDGRGQGAAVAAGLELAGRAGATTPFLVVNADLPCVTARDLLALAGTIPDHGLALVAAADGTTNALALSSQESRRSTRGNRLVTRGHKTWIRCRTRSRLSSRRRIARTGFSANAARRTLILPKKKAP